MRIPIDVYILIPVFVKLVTTIFPTQPIYLFLLQNAILFTSLLITNFIHQSVNSDICKEKNLSVNYFKRFIKSGSDALLLHSFGILSSFILILIPPIRSIIMAGAQLPFGSNVIEALLYSVGMIIAYVVINSGDSAAYSDKELCEPSLSGNRIVVSIIVFLVAFTYQFFTR